MDMEFPWGRGTQLEKSWKFQQMGQGVLWSPLSWGQTVFLNHSLSFLNALVCTQGLIQKGNKIEFYLVHLSYLLVFNIIFAYIKCTVFNYP